VGSGTLAVIHCEPGIPWQPVRAGYLAEGFQTVGIPCSITSSRTRIDSGFPVLLGTTCWRGIERDGGEFLLVDRCSFGDTERFVQLVWNGHGRRGNHRVPERAPGYRWDRYGCELGEYQTHGSRVVLCGQTETYSPRYSSLKEWYESVRATHFKCHPAGGNPTGLPDVRGFEDCRCAVTLNSSVGVQCVLAGVPTITGDEGAMAWDVTGHSLEDIRMPDREPWCHWLAWTQWTDDELRQGEPWAYLL
jgi:hypothetical protein